VHGGLRGQGGSSTFSGAGFNNGIENSAAAVTGVTVAAAYTGVGVEPAQPAITIQSATTGLQVGAAGGAETVPQNIAMDYYIKAVNDSAVSGIVTGIDTSDPQMIAINSSNPVVPVLDIKSNLPFGIPKLDLNGQISISQLPAGVQTFLGTFDCSGGQNPSEKYPTATFVNGNTYLVAVGGTITVYNPATNTAAPTAVDLGWNLVWVSNPDQPVGWYFIEAPTVTAATASSVAFVPAGTIGATNVQAAIQELDSETQTALSGKAALGNAVPTMNGTAAPGVATAASRTDHVHPTDTSRAPTSAGTAVGTSVTPVGNLSATNVQAALAELDSEINAAPASGTVLQMRFFTDAGQGTLPATLANVTQTTKNFAPKSINSTIKVSVSFYGYSSDPGAFINVQIKETTQSIGSVGELNSVGLNPTGVAQSILLPIIEGLLPNNALTPLGFQLWANNSIGAGNGAVTNMVWTITEVQN
jgi:hypothetical protein